MGDQGLISNGREVTVVDIQKGNTGDVGWVVLDADAEVDAPSGGGVSYETDWGRSEIGSSVYYGQHATGNPAVATTNIKARIKAQDYLAGLLRDSNIRWDGDACNANRLNLRIRFRCGDMRDVSNWQEILYLYDVKNTSFGFDNMVADSSTGVDENIKQTEAIQAGFMFRQAPLLHRDISGATLTTAQNKIIWLGGNKFVTASESASVGVSPGLTGYTSDNGATWAQESVTPFTSGHTTDVTESGRYVIYAGSADGCAYVDKKELLAGTGTYTASTGIATNFPSFVDTCPNGRVWAVGDGGYVWKSDDNGITFVQQGFSASATTENITSIHAVQDNKVFCGLANGGILVINGLDNPTATVIANSVTGTTDQIDALICGTHPSLKNLIIGTDAGEIFKTTDRNATAPTFTQPSFPNTGVGGIRAFDWGSLYCEALYIVQDNASPVGQVIRDLSGGALGDNQIEIANTTAFLPTNAGMNDIAIARNRQGTSTGSGLSCGEVVSSQGFIGEVTSEAS